jgi:flagellar basal-body rod modification protein FlgD
MSLDGITYVDSSTNQTTTSSSSTSSLDKDDFLRLLITKLTYQDPLNPASDEDFVAQLAQFSSLEQLEQMNTNLATDLQWNYLLSQTISNTMSTSLIGRTIVADSSELQLDTAGTAQICLNLPESAQNLTIKIIDEDGETVRTISVDSPGEGDIAVSWDGLDDNGVQAPAGLYTIEAEATNLDDEAITPSLYVEGKVEAVSYVNGIAYLNVNGQSIPLSSVREVRES